MIQIFKNPKFDFMRWRTAGYCVSGIMILACLGTILWHKSRTGDPLNYGIDFRGGSQFEVRFVELPELDDLRKRLDAGGFANANLQQFGKVEENTVLVRVADHLEGSSDLVSRIRLALRSDEGRQSEASGLVDLNIVSDLQLARMLEAGIAGGEVSSVAQEYQSAATALVALRQKRPNGLFASLQDVKGAAELTDPMFRVLEKQCFVGDLSFERSESVGPAVGQDLRRKALLATIVANGLILIYLWFRFELRFGVAAVLCLVHDALAVVGIFALTDREFDLTVLAAILTVIGYSVNDTIVIFDRIRSNLKTMTKVPLEAVINLSVNQTLSRTILTTGLTLLVVVPLLIWGGAALGGFSFALLVGMIVGIYSTVFVASPLVLLWDRLAARA